MKKQFLIFAVSLFLLAGCGASTDDTQNAETLPPVQDLIKNNDNITENTTVSTTNDDIDNDGIKNSEDDDMDGDGIKNSEDDDMDGDGIPNSEDTNNAGADNNENSDSNTSGDLTSCEEKASDSIKELEKANEKIKSLESNLAVYRDNKGQSVDAYSDIITDYIKNVSQKEYSFDSCGAVGKFFNASWYNDFKSTLADKDVLFSLQSRALEPADFFGGCASSAGNMAFFLGAGFQNEVEFHMFKYDIGTGDLKETMVVGGKCEDCPVQFGKRNGPYIELYGDANTLYRYYFDKNILIKDSELQ